MNTVIPRDPRPHDADPLDFDIAAVVPSWAQGVLRSKESAPLHGDTPRNELDVQHDANSGLQFVSVLGFHAVAIERPSSGSVLAAINLLKRLRESRPLDVGMLAFGDKVRLSAKSINQLARIGVMVSRTRGENALAQANAAVAEYLTLQRLGYDHLLKFTATSRDTH